MLGTADITNGELDHLTDSQVKSYSKYLTKQLKLNNMKKAGFELYKTKDLKPKLDAFYKIQKSIKNLK